MSHELHVKKVYFTFAFQYHWSLRQMISTIISKEINNFGLVHAVEQGQ